MKKLIFIVFLFISLFFETVAQNTAKDQTKQINRLSIKTDSVKAVQIESSSKFKSKSDSDVIKPTNSSTNISNLTLPLLTLIVTSLISGFIALIITILFQERLIRFFLFKFGKLPTKPQRKITGIWYSIFWFVNADNKVVFKQNIFKILRFWNSYSGKTVAGRDHQIKIYGSTKIDTYVIGKWEHTNTDNYYHGSFQFIIEPEGDRIHGRWIGFNKKNVVSMGPWIMVRMVNENSKHTDEELEKKYAINGIIQFEMLPKQVQETVKAILKQQNSKEVYCNWKKAHSSDLLV